MQKYLQQLKNQKELTTVILGMLAFSFILVATLNLTLSFLIFVVFIDLAIFQKSFHFGWIFSVLVIVILPTVYIADNLVSVGEIFTLVLAFVGFGNLLFDKHKIKLFPLFYYWLGIIILGGILILLGDNSVNVGKEINQITLYQLIMIFVIYPIIIISFQYFFQTKKRLEKFFLIITAIGMGQALFGLLARVFKWELVDGIGITGETFANLPMQNNFYQITAFFGDKLFLQLGDNILATLLLITIPVTLGMWLMQKFNLSTIAGLTQLQTNNFHFRKIIDSVFGDRKNEISRIIDLKMPLRLKANRERFFLFLFVIQMAALIFTFSYMSLIILGVGISIMGILLREQKVILITLLLLLVFIMFLPGFESVSIIRQKTYLITLWHDLRHRQNFSWLWRGLDENWREQIYNSYLVIFSKFGLIGLGLFLSGLWQYFQEIRLAYLKSDGFERIWLVVILAIFIEFVLLGVFSNVLFVGPVALLFWLLYGALQNLKYNQIEFGLTETRLNKTTLKKEPI